MGKTRKHRPNEWDDGSPKVPSKSVFADARRGPIKGAAVAPREDAMTPIPVRKTTPGNAGGQGR